MVDLLEVIWPMNVQEAARINYTRSYHGYCIRKSTTLDLKSSAQWRFPTYHTLFQTAIEIPQGTNICERMPQNENSM